MKQTTIPKIQTTKGKKAYKIRRTKQHLHKQKNNREVKNIVGDDET